ncbi:MAG: hypothetical protein M3144_00975, partial [Actinomycetota bacterium]|nr:hypothetical protein [Actinomycetota bacterium]
GWDCYWAQRYWVAVEWGDEDDRYRVLDYCRERAYRSNDVGWRGSLTLLLAALARTDEAVREFEATVTQFDATRPSGDTRIDVLTNLAEAAAVLGDPERARMLRAPLETATEPMVLIQPAWICKGDIARYHGLLAATMGDWAGADDSFRRAVGTHRHLGAAPLLARTLRQWGQSLIGRDDALAHHCLDESAQLAGRLQLAALPSG